MTGKVCVCLVCVCEWVNEFLFIFHRFKMFRFLHLFGRNVLSLSLSLSLSHWAAEQCRLCLSVVLVVGLTQLTPCCSWKIVHQFSDLMATFCSCEMRMCSLRLYLFLKFLLQRSHLRGGWGVCWVRICLQRFTVVMTILQNWHSVHLLLGESKNIQKNRTNYTIIFVSFCFVFFSFLIRFLFCALCGMDGRMGLGKGVCRLIKWYLIVLGIHIHMQCAHTHTDRHFGDIFDANKHNQ